MLCVHKKIRELKQVLKSKRTKESLSILMGVLILGSVGTNASVAFAADEESFSLEQIVVTATRTEKNVIDTAASISVITAEDIKQMNVMHVDEALAKVPGIYVGRLSGMSSTTSQIVVRGLSSTNSTLVLVNGRPANDTYNGGVYWSSIPIQTVERIEVLRGGASALYGSGAMGGVVNIITKDDETSHGNTSYRYGSNNTQQFETDYTARINDKWAVGMNYEHNRTTGTIADYKTQTSYAQGAIATTTNAGKTTYIVGDKGKRGWDEDNYGFNVKYNFDNTKYLKFSFDKNEQSYTYGIPHSYIGTTPTAAGGWYNTPGKNGSNNYNLQYNDNDNGWDINAGYNDMYMKKTTSISSTNTVTDNPNSRSYFDLQKTQELSSKNTLVWGTHYNKDKFSQTKTNSAKGITSTAYGNAHSEALYISDEHKLDDSWTVTSGLRYDRWTREGGSNIVGKRESVFESNTFDQVSPSVSLSYKLDDTSNTYIAWNRSFEAPSLYRMYSESASGDITNIGNPELKPQKAETTEIGYKKKMGKNTDLALSVYHVKYTELLSQVKTSDTTTQYINLDKVDCNGFEIELNHRFDKTTNAFANYTYQNPEANSGATVTYIPKKSFNMGINYQKDKWSSMLFGSYVSKRVSSAADTVNNVYTSYDPYFVMNWNARYAVNKNASIVFGVDNLLNRDYYNYYPQAGRTYSVGFNYTY
jgi:iron complex outermembrane receptor protein